MNEVVEFKKLLKMRLRQYVGKKYAIRFAMRAGVGLSSIHAWLKNDRSDERYEAVAMDLIEEYRLKKVELIEKLRDDKSE